MGMKLPEADEIVTRAYQEILGRPPDKGGRWGKIQSLLCGMTEEELRQTMMQSKEYTDINVNKETSNGEAGKINGITFVSSWKIKCGIAIYTENLINSLNRIEPNVYNVHPLNDKNGVPYSNIVHLQNELGIMPTPPDVDNRSKVMITWHTVRTNMGIIKEFESKLNVVAHIATSAGAAMCIKESTKKEVQVIPLGTTLIPNISNEDACSILQIDKIKKPVGFVFGFQSANKKYSEMIQAANIAGIHLLISGAEHESGYTAKSLHRDYNNVTFIDRYLTEPEVSLFALAADILIFDYISMDHHSSSAAMHRLIGAGRPVVCSDINHFSELTDGKNCIKFKDAEGLERSIIKALNPINYENLSKEILQYAFETSWNEAAKKHKLLYEKWGQ